jgi:hypothetical protein
LKRFFMKVLRKSATFGYNAREFAREWSLRFVPVPTERDKRSAYALFMSTAPSGELSVAANLASRRGQKLPLGCAKSKHHT